MLAVLTTHPIQYQVPIWKALAARGRVPIRVYYLSNHGHAASHDPGFGHHVAWDIDLLDGYDHSFAKVSAACSQSSFWWMRLSENIAQRARRDGATTLWLQGWQVAAYWQALRQAQGQGLELWLRGETNLRSTGQKSLAGAKRFIHSKFLRAFNKVLYIGEANRQFYLSRGVPAERLAPAPYCVENERFRADAVALRPSRDELRARWSIAPDAFCVAFVGKLIPKKRPLDIVAAVSSLKARHPDRPIHILFVGSGELGAELRARCNVVANVLASSPPTGSVGRPDATFTGFLNQREIAAAYVAADCLVLPSEATETWGLVVNEAMACGLPAVVSDAVGCSEDLVGSFRPDLTFPVGNIAALASALDTVRKDPPSGEKLLELIDRFDVLRTVETVEDLYLARQ